MTKKDFERDFRLLMGYVVDAVVFGCLYALVWNNKDSDLPMFVFGYLYLALSGFVLFWGTTLYARLSVKAEDYTIRLKDTVLSALLSVIPFGIVFAVCLNSF